MMISYKRTGGTQPPLDNERLKIRKDGQFVLWRSIGWATVPPTPIGRFAGQLEPSMLSELRGMIDAAKQAGDYQSRAMPGVPIETVKIGKVRAEVAAGSPLQGAWLALFTQLRAWLQELTRMPEAAVGLEVSDDGRQAQLVHLGTAVLRLDLSECTVRATQRNPQTGETLAEWRAAETNLGGIVQAQPGWTWDLPFQHGFSVIPDSHTRAIVNLTILDGKKSIPASLASV